LRASLLTALLAVLTSTAVMAAVMAPPPKRQAELIYLLRQDCGACHGMLLKGGLGPALTPQRLHKRDVNQLANTILSGRPGTPMPPWRPFINAQEAHWLAHQLQRGIHP